MLSSKMIVFCGTLGSRSQITESSRPHEITDETNTHEWPLSQSETVV